MPVIIKQHSVRTFRASCGRNAMGFTIVELMIMLGSIFLILSMALPMINNSRRNATRTLCMDRIRGLAKKSGYYASDHDGHINENTNGFASRIEQVGPEQKDHVDAGPIFDIFAGGWNTPGSKLYESAAIFYCPIDRDNSRMTLKNHANGLSNSPVLIGFYRAGHRMATGAVGNQINVQAVNYNRENPKKALWIERTLNHIDGANVAYIDEHVSFVKMEFDVTFDPVNAFRSANGFTEAK